MMRPAYRMILILLLVSGVIALANKPMAAYFVTSLDIDEDE